MTICRFAKDKNGKPFCSGYREYAFTCNNDEEADGYCGYYEKHKLIKKRKWVDKLFRIGMITK